MKMKKKIPTEADLKNFNVESWGTWTKEVSEFDWSYGDTETCYILEGEFEVTDSETGEKMDFKKGNSSFQQNLVHLRPVIKATDKSCPNLGNQP